jgi:hypothetical protein
MFLGSKVRRVRKADNLTVIYEPIVLDNVGSLTSHNPIDLQGLLRDSFFFLLGEVGWGDVDWIGLARDRNRWRALVNSVLNLRVPLNAGKLSSGLKLLASRVVFSYIELVS